jgi:hypothetical protein
VAPQVRHEQPGRPPAAHRPAGGSTYGTSEPLQPVLSVSAAIVSGMSSATTLPDPPPVPPAADPQAIRTCLTATLAAEFDREWEIVLDRVKQSMDLAGLHELLNKWLHTAYMEMRDPGSYYRMLGKAEQILRTESNPDAVPFEEMQALIRQRQGQ